MITLLRNNKILCGPIIFMAIAAVLFFAIPLEAQAYGHWTIVGKALGISVGSLFETLVKDVALGILSLFAFLTGLAGMLFNFVIIELVLNFGTMVTTTGFGTPIDVGWKVIRDVVNLIFIFSLLYIGIMTIIDAGRINTKRLLASIIIAVLLVNFSLFFSKAIIDVSNLVAVTLYNQMTRVQAGTAGAITNDYKSGISGQFMASMGIHTVFSPDPARALLFYEKIKEKRSVGFVILYSFVGSFFMMKLMFAFLLGSVILAIRFVMLIFLMILSPIAFASSVFPFFGQLSSRWWSAMLGQAFLAPIYLFILYIVLIMLGGSPWRNLKIESLLEAGSNNSLPAMEFIAFFLLAIIGIIGAAIIGKQLSSAGATGTMTAVGWAKRRVQGSIGASIRGGAAGAGAFGRFAVGRDAAAALKNEKWVTEQNKTWRGRMKLRATEIAAKSSFDVRKAPGVAAAAKATGVDVGKASSASADKSIKATEKREAARAKAMGEEPMTAEREYEISLKTANAKEIGEAITTAFEKVADADRDGDMNEKQRLLDMVTEYRKDEDVIKNDILKLEKPRQMANIERLEKREKSAYDATFRWGVTSSKALRKEITKGDPQKLIDAVRESKESTPKEN